VTGETRTAAATMLGTITGNSKIRRRPSKLAFPYPVSGMSDGAGYNGAPADLRIGGDTIGGTPAGDMHERATRTALASLGA
jgi:hypothetical protein